MCAPSRDPALLSIGKAPKKPPARISERISNGPLADKFFCIGLLGGFLGVTYLGVHLWLMLSGQMPAGVRYFDLRALHAQMNIFLFLGLFIAGIAIQAGPRMMNSDAGRPSWILMGAVLPLFGVLLSAIAGRPTVTSSAVIACGFALSFAFMVRACRRASPSARASVGYPLLFSLGVLAAGSFADLADPKANLAILWAVLGSAMLGTAGHFIRNFLGGRALESRCRLLVHTLFIGSIIFAGLGALLQSESCVRLFGAFAFGSVAVFAARTRLFTALPAARHDAKAFAFVSGFTWALVATAYLAARGPAASDFSLHFLALGWAVPLMFVLSTHITSFLSGRPAPWQRAQLVVLLLWQITVVGRGGAHLLHLPFWMSWAVGFASLPLFGHWMVSLFLGESAIVVRQLGLRGAERMVDG